MSYRQQTITERPPGLHVAPASPPCPRGCGSLGHVEARKTGDRRGRRWMKSCPDCGAVVRFGDGDPIIDKRRKEYRHATVL